MICAGQASGSIGSCMGNSGGPLACREGDGWYLAGVVNWGGCTNPNYAGLYARVLYFKDWIEQEIGNTNMGRSLMVMLCENGGVWTKDGCECKAGYTGSSCQTDTNECFSTPCEHESTCEDRMNGYLCVCAAGYTGVNCASELPHLIVPVQLSWVSEFRPPPYAYVAHRTSISLQGNSLVWTNKESNQLEKWELSLGTNNVTQTSLVWSVPLPEGLRVNCVKHQTPTGDRIVLQNWGMEPIVLVDGATGREIRRWTSKRVIGATSNAVGSEKETKDSSTYRSMYKLELLSMEDHTQVISLLTRGRWCALCEEPHTGRIAVIDCVQDKLFIFSKDTQRRTEVHLPFTPDDWHSVVSVSQDLLAVLHRDWRTVSLHSWATGELMQTVDGLVEESDNVMALGVEERVLHLWVHAYTANNKFAVVKTISYRLT